MSRSVNSIMNEVNDLRTTHAGRQQDYRTLRAIYHGLFYDRTSRDIMDGAGRTILRDARRGSEQQPLVANLLKAIADDYVALTGQTPDTKVPKPGMSPADQEFADLVEKFHYGVQHASRFRLHTKAMAWFNSVMGSCAGLVWPDFQRRHAKIRIIGPDKVFGVPDLLDEYSYSSACIVESFSAKTIEDYFPNKKFRSFVEDRANRRATWWGENGRVEIIRYFDKKEVVTILGRETKDIKVRDGESRGLEPIIEMGRAEHDLGMCTVVPFQNFLIPGELRSISDIEEAVGLNQWINFLLNSHEEGIRQELFAPLVLIDPDKAPEDIDLSDPMAIIPIRKGGDAKRLPGPTGVQQVMSGEIQRGQSLIEYVTGSSQIRTQGKQPGSSIATGRSLDKGQGPLMSRIDMRNDLNTVSWEKINELTVAMTGQLFENDEISLFGTKSRSGSSLFKMTIRGRDLEGYTYNVVTYPASMYMGMEQRIIAMEQLMGGKHQMVSRRTAMEFIGLVDHPDEELAAIEADQMKAVEFEKRLASAGQGGGDQGGSSNGGPSPMERAVSMEHGSTRPSTGGASAPSARSAATGGGAGARAPLGAPSPATGRAELPPGPPPQPEGSPNANLGGSLADQVEAAVVNAKPKGQTWIVDGGDKVTVLASSQPDVLKLRRKIMPFFANKVVVRERPKDPKKMPPNAKEVGRSGASAPTAQPPQAAPTESPAPPPAGP